MKKLTTKNKFEESVYLRLKRSRCDFGYEVDKIPYVRIQSYLPDFTIRLKSGIIRYIETKGYLRPTDRTKMLAVKRCNPDLDIRIIFQQNKKLSKRSNTTYLEWAEKNGFPAAVGKIPKEWLIE